MIMLMNSLVLFIARFTLGFFFVSYRFRWFYDPATQDGVAICSPYRHKKLIEKMGQCGWGMSPKLAAFIAIAETLAGLGVMFGFLNSLSALGLLIILIAASACTAKEKTLRQNPIDKIDVVNCYLWNPEPVYIVLAIVVMVLGPGWFAIDTVMK